MCRDSATSSARASSRSSPPAEPATRTTAAEAQLLVVIFGPGGVGKGTLARHLVAADERLWLSRSWTTRPKRPGEPSDAYVFVDTDTFRSNELQGGFLETNEFAANGHLYGTPWPDGVDGRDVVFEIDLNGALQVKERYPDAVLVLVVPPDREELERRLRGRGDPEEDVRRRLELAELEMEEGRGVADHVVINDDLGRAVGEVASILDRYRSS